jgi:T5orf172 domain
MANGLPYFRWYPADAEMDEDYAAMTDQELGFYHRCLNRSWLNDGLPFDLDELARIMRVPRKYLDKVWKRVGNKFVGNAHSRLVNPRQEKERDKAIVTSATRAHGTDPMQAGEVGFIYFVRRSRDLAVKIGSSKNVSKRLSQLKYKYGTEVLSLIGKVQVADMGMAESRLHEQFSAQRVYGDWFQLADSDIATSLLSATPVDGISATPDATPRGDTDITPPYHPDPPALARADSDSVYVAAVEFKSKKTSARFEELWKRWPRQVGMDSAARDWVTYVTEANESEVFACADRYLDSREVSEGKVLGLGTNQNRIGWLAQAAKDNWKQNWPARPKTRAEKNQEGWDSV